MPVKLSLLDLDPKTEIRIGRGEDRIVRNRSLEASMIGKIDMVLIGMIGDRVGMIGIVEVIGIPRNLIMINREDTNDLVPDPDQDLVKSAAVKPMATEETGKPKAPANTPTT